MLDVAKFVGELHDYIGNALGPIIGRIKSLEDRAQKGGEKGADGRDGKDAEPILLADVVCELVAAPELKTLIDLLVAEGVQKHFEAHPVRHGKDGERGAQGERGEKGETGADGVGIAGHMIDRDGNLIVTTTKGEARNLGRVVGTDGKDGRDGKDGMSITDVTRAYDAETHEIVERWKVGDTAKELRIPAGGWKLKGFWRDGMKCEGGDAVTHDGALFIAKRNTTSKPCVENADDWQLAARKGRDGKDGRNGIDKTAPVKLTDSTGPQ